MIAHLDISSQGCLWLVCLSICRLRCPHNCIVSLCAIELSHFRLFLVFVFLNSERIKFCNFPSDSLYVKYSSEINEQKGKYVPITMMLCCSKKSDLKKKHLLDFQIYIKRIHRESLVDHFQVFC